MLLHGFSLLAGTPGQPGGKTFHATNPATNTHLEPAFHEASAAEVAAALTASAVAFTAYRQRSGAERAQFLEAIALEIEALGELLIQRAHAESGLPQARLIGERGRTCGQLRLFASVVREGPGSTRGSIPRCPTASHSRAPISAACSSPSVPSSSSAPPTSPRVLRRRRRTASALAAGCTVVVKAHRAHPGTAELVATAINRAIVTCGLPPATFSSSTAAVPPPASPW